MIDLAKRHGSKTVEKDLGISRINALRAQLKKNPRIKAGILESAGAHKNEDGEPSGLTVAQVALFNEFGNSRTPARPWMRYSALVLKQPMQALMGRLLLGMIQGVITLDNALDRAGQYVVAQKKKIIRDWDSPPNAPSTIAAKARKAGRKRLAKARKADAGKLGPGRTESLMAGFNNPLVDTAQMLNSVDYVKENNK